MRVIVFKVPGPPSVLSLGSRPIPSPRSHDLLIRVAAAGVNGPDIAQRRGVYPAPPGASSRLGLEVAGVVEAVGEGVTGWNVGDAVAALTNGGGYAEFCVAPAGQCLPVPPGVPFVAAAALPESVFTVWHNVFQRGGLAKGDTLLVHGGTSGIGTTAIALARRAGATVAATAGSAGKVRRLENELGVDFAVSYEEDWVGALRGANLAPDLILDVAAGDFVGKNVDVAAVDGRIVVIGVNRGVKATINAAKLMSKRLVLTGSTLRPQSAAAKAAIAADVAAHVLPAVASGEFTPKVDRVFGLEDAEQAHEYMESRQHFGKIVLEVDGGLLPHT